MNAHTQTIHTPTANQSEQKLTPKYVSTTEFTPKPEVVEKNLVTIPAATPATTPEVAPEVTPAPDAALVAVLLDELGSQVGNTSSRVLAVAQRMASEVERICRKSDRIQATGDIHSWQLSLGRHRLEKCLQYYQLGSKQGRKELHSNLSVMVYRHIAPAKAQLNFSARYNLIEDFLQDFYVESIKAFRRESELPSDYQPRTQLELSEYMAFTEQYAKRRINLFNGFSQQLIILRAQNFAKRQPAETSVDIEAAVETQKTEEGLSHSRSAIMQQLRSHLVSEAIDPAESVLRDRVVAELIKYLEEQGQSECVDYLTLKLSDLSAAEIDDILQLTPRQRDYLQQRFKYHVEKFAHTAQWELVHQWLGADLDQKLGMVSQKWQVFFTTLTLEQQQLLELKQSQYPDDQICKLLSYTPKQLQKRWTTILTLASKFRNQD